jgi:cob(I)alamin adenosyltransferase
MKARIYTKTGDRGQTSLVGGTRVSKTDTRLEAYGTLDELNSVLGIVRAQLRTSSAPPFTTAVESSLQRVQNNLFDIGSHLACEDAKLQATLPMLPPEDLAALEKSMDEWEQELPPLRSFILPGGTPLAAYAHLARTVCRRAERECVRLAQTATVDPAHLVYLNRLSDWLFLLARQFNFQAQVEDLPWQK